MNGRGWRRQFCRRHFRRGSVRLKRAAWLEPGEKMRSSAWWSRGVSSRRLTRGAETRTPRKRTFAFMRSVFDCKKYFQEIFATATIKDDPAMDDPPGLGPAAISRRGRLHGLPPLGLPRAWREKNRGIAGKTIFGTGGNCSIKGADFAGSFLQNTAAAACQFDDVTSRPSRRHLNVTPLTFLSLYFF